MTLTEILEEKAKENKNTVVFIYRDQKITFGELENQAKRLAQSLNHLGIRPGERFAVCLRNSPEFVITTFALMRLGATSVHINFLVNEQEIAYILADCGVRVLVTSADRLQQLAPVLARCPELAHVVLIDDLCMFGRDSWMNLVGSPELEELRGFVDGLGVWKREERDCMMRLTPLHP